MFSVFAVCLSCTTFVYAAVEKTTKVSQNTYKLKDNDECKAGFMETANENEYKKSKFLCNNGRGICTTTKQGGQTFYTCANVSCPAGSYLKVRTDNGKYSTNGACAKDDDCTKITEKDEANTSLVEQCKRGYCRLDLSRIEENEWSNTYVSQYIKSKTELKDQEVVILVNNNKSIKCKLKFDVCTEERVKRMYATEYEETTDVQNSADEKDWYCKPTKCMDKYILPKDPITQNNASCELCKETNGKGGTLTGSDGIHECIYSDAPAPEVKENECDDETKNAHQTIYDNAVKEIIDAYKSNLSKINGNGSVATATSTEINTTVGYIHAEEFFTEVYNVEDFRFVVYSDAEPGWRCYVADKNKPEQENFYGKNERTINTYGLDSSHQNACKDLGLLGRWEVTLDGVGIFRGDSKCASNKGEKDKNRNVMQGKPEGEGGYCWCQLNSAPRGDFNVGDFVPYATNMTASSSRKLCLEGCAHRCKMDFVNNESNFRKAILGFYDGE